MSPAASTGAKLRTAGFLILLLGLVAAGTIYFLGRRAPNYEDDPSMIGFDKHQTRQMEQMYGQSGQLMDDLLTSLKKPTTQAGIIAAVSIVCSLVCFRLAEPGPSEEIEK